MKESLQTGISLEHKFIVPMSKTVPELYPESAEFAAMPVVFATGYLVGFIEWACILAVIPHIDWPLEQTVGTHVNISHLAATPPGQHIIAQVELIEIDGRRLMFAVEVNDETDLISRGRHERFIINREKFDARLKHKSTAA